MLYNIKIENFESDIISCFYKINKIEGEFNLFLSDLN